ncbi:GPI ethanolamine phosphate transferase 2 isoform X1 [Hylaeus anthracinus]|uniref:GPI ethanolamine phosphate transferase 2 isoform X1 n=1 Tax=Hylaeus anthracinus TaxID=313031 RepID=UPI0023B8DEF7|nr:GPI ethanolamine phosphate transferase 2 isoform X1 [Hylaeus anthracinus]
MIKIRGKEMDKDIVILLYIIFIGPLSISLFLYGFFPLIKYDSTIATENDIPQFIDNVRVKVDTLYQPVVKKLIIMIIDALRWDFITGSIGKLAMPVTSSLITNSSACLLQAHVQPPTVTMPRIKAITTGTIPSFIDVALNFGSKPVTGDSVLLQAKRYGYKTVFYGDDTWLTLFPSMFDRYDGTTSFFVTDFTEVDNNITRHLNKDLHNTNDWSIMILHYLGLDHIGHVHGPFSPLIKTKLTEMDNIIVKIQSKVQEWNENNESSLFIICGDHGMKDSGGHGGSTTSETTVPFIAIGGECTNNHFTEVSQIDIASTLSTIMGVPIPFYNLGTVFTDTLYDLPVSKKLFILYYNAKQVFNHFQKLPDYKSEYAYQKYLEAIKLHNAWLTTKDYPNHVGDDIVLSYKVALKGMKEMLISSMIKFDLHIITVAIFFLCHIICISMGKECYTSVAFKSTISLIALNTSLWILINYTLKCESISFLYTKSLITIVIVLFIITVLATNCYLIANINYFNPFIIEKRNGGVGRWLFPISTLVHAISLSGSSFVEEEHQTWYFYWVTLLVLLLYNSATQFFLHLPSYRNYEQYSYAQTCIKLLLLLIGHRILRKLNSTGDKYAHLPDIAGFLAEQESMLSMTILLITALALLMWLDFIHEDKSYKIRSLVFNTIICVCIYLRHMHNNSVGKIPLYPQSRGVYEVQIFWVLLAINAVNCIYRLVFKIKSDKTTFLKTTLCCIVRTWIMITAMLHQPHNVILLPFQIIFISVISTIIKYINMQQVNTFVYAWAGSVFYFYQGNSNSLATIDVAAGYIGIQSYVPFINGSLLLINTYSAPVLAFLLLVYHAALQYPYDTCKIIIEISKTYIRWRLIPIAIYTIIISIQRHHLFVWSVFSPKLLYEAVHSTITCFVIFIITILVILQEAINNYNR